MSPVQFGSVQIMDVTYQDKQALDKKLKRQLDEKMPEGADYARSDEFYRIHMAQSLGHALAGEGRPVFSKWLNDSTESQLVVIRDDSAGPDASLFFEESGLASDSIREYVRKGPKVFKAYAERAQSRPKIPLLVRDGEFLQDPEPFRLDIEV